MAQWIYLNLNNRSVLAHRYSVLEEKTGPILLLLVGLQQGGKPADEMRVGFEIFKILYRLNYLGFFCLLSQQCYCSIRNALQLTLVK